LVADIDVEHLEPVGQTHLGLSVGILRHHAIVEVFHVERLDKRVRQVLVVRVHGVVDLEAAPALAQLALHLDRARKKPCEAVTTGADDVSAAAALAPEAYVALAVADYAHITGGLAEDASVAVSLTLDAEAAVAVALDAGAVDAVADHNVAVALALDAGVTVAQALDAGAAVARGIEGHTAVTLVSTPRAPLVPVARTAGTVATALIQIHGLLFPDKLFSAVNIVLLLTFSKAPTSEAAAAIARRSNLRVSVGFSIIGEASGVADGVGWCGCREANACPRAATLAVCASWVVSFGSDS
jgi:hypothetical protein